MVGQFFVVVVFHQLAQEGEYGLFVLVKALNIQEFEISNFL